MHNFVSTHGWDLSFVEFWASLWKFRASIIRNTCLWPSVHPFIQPSIHPSIRPPIRSFVHPFVRPSVHPSENFRSPNFTLYSADVVSRPRTPQLGKLSVLVHIAENMHVPLVRVLLHVGRLDGFGRSRSNGKVTLQQEKGHRRYVNMSFDIITTSTFILGPPIL